MPRATAKTPAVAMIGPAAVHRGGPEPGRMICLVWLSKSRIPGRDHSLL
jgi:hypothetical protein